MNPYWTAHRPVTSPPGYLTSSSGRQGYCTHMHTPTYRRINIYNLKNQVHIFKKAKEVTDWASCDPDECIGVTSTA